MGGQLRDRGSYTQLQRVRNKRFPQVRRRSHIDYCEKSNILNKVKVPKHIRQKVILRDNFTCVYCGIVCYEKRVEQGKKLTKEFLRDFLTLDHVLPRSLGGSSHDIDNLVCCCWTCNFEKSNKIS